MGAARITRRPSSNDNQAENAMASTLEQLIVDRETPEQWRVRFSHPPINLVEHRHTGARHCH